MEHNNLLIVLVRDHFLVWRRHCTEMNSSVALSAEDLDLLSPFPDIVALFLHYNSLYFSNELHTTSVQWSSERMTRYGETLPAILAIFLGAVVRSAAAVAIVDTDTLRCPAA